MNDIDLSTIRTEKDALDQSIALNKIVMTMLENQRENNKRICAALIVSIVINLLTVVGFLWHDSQFDRTVTTETTTITSSVEQDTGEGSGNNVYQEGENAVYNQTDGGGN